MKTFGFLLSLFSVTDAFAQQPAAPSGGQAFMSMLPMFAMVFLIFYFLVFKPQQKKLKEQQSLIEGLKKGEDIVLSSGIIGRVAGVEKDHILVEIDKNVRLKVEPSHVARKLEVK